MKIVFMGTPEFAVPILEALALKYDVCLVVSQPNRAKKKGVLVPTPVAACASRLKIELFQPEKIKDNFETIIEKKADLLITAAYGQYIPSKILNSFKLCLNVHASLLPKHRGGAPIQRCLMNQDKETGVSIMEMVSKLDAGKVYVSEKYEILEEDNASLLFQKLSIIGKNLLLKHLDEIYSGKIIGILQKEEEATYSYNIKPEEERINLNDASLKIIHQIRGLSYEPGAYLMVYDVKIKVFKAREVKWEGVEEAGTVLDVKKRILLKTKDSAIELLELLYPGKKILSGKDFSNGQKIFIAGDILN